MQCDQVTAFVNADRNLRKLRKDASVETKRLIASVKDAMDAAIAEMLDVGCSVVRVDNSTWVVLTEKKGIFPKLSVDALTETLKCMDNPTDSPSTDGPARDPVETGVHVRDYVRKSLTRRSEGTVSLTVQSHPPSGKHSTDGEEECRSFAAGYVDAISARNVHLDRLRQDCAEAAGCRFETQAAAVDFVAPDGGALNVPMYRRVECTESATPVFIKVVFRERKRAITRSTFMQLVDNELRSRVSTMSEVLSDAWLCEFRDTMETAISEKSGITEVSTHVSVTDTAPNNVHVT